MPVISRILWRSNVGASLLANAIDHSMNVSTDMPHSRAGSLPQLFGGDFERVVCSRLRQYPKAFSPEKVGQI
ncbi:Secreted protein [Pseudomonas sp. IT-P260]